MTVALPDLVGKIRIDDSALDKVQGKMQSFGQGMASIGSKLTLGLTVPIAAAGAKMFSMAADAEDATSAMNVVFGKSANVIEEWSKNSATGMGLTSTEAKKAATDLAIFGKAGGLAGKDLEGFATQQTQLSADLASFKGTSVEEAMTAIGAAYRGEMEPIRAYGVLLDAQKIKQEAVSLGLIKEGEELTDNAKLLATRSLILKQTSDQQGDFARTSEGAANKMKILSAQIKEQATAIGVQLLPIGQKILGFFSDLLGAFSKLGPGGQSFVILLGGIAAAAGPVLFIVGKFLTVLPALKVAFVAMTGPVGLIVAGVAALAAGLIYAYKHSETFRNIVQGVFAAVAGAFERAKEIWQAFVDAFQGWEPQSGGVLGFFSELGNKAGIAFDTVRIKLGELKAWWDSIWPQFSEAISHVWAVIEGLFTTAFAIISGAWKLWGDDLLTVLKGVWTAISAVVEGALQVIQGIIQTVLAVINGDWGRAWDGIKMIFEGVWTAIKGIVEGALGVIKGVIGGAWDAVKSFTSSAWDSIRNAVSDKINGLVDLARGIPGKITSALGDLGGLLYGAGKAVVQGLINGIGAMASNLAEAARKVASSALSAAKKALGIASPSKITKNFGVELINGLIIGIQSMTQPLTRQMAGIADIVSGSQSYGGAELAGIPSGRGVATSAVPTAVGGNTYNVAVNLNGWVDFTKKDVATRQMTAVLRDAIAGIETAGH